jgi:hypothetical protein
VSLTETLFPSWYKSLLRFEWLPLGKERCFT